MLKSWMRPSESGGRDNPWRRLTAASNRLIERSGIPRRVLSRLLDSASIGVGSSVLEVGCGCGDLSRYLSSLGIQCTGIDESPANIVEARKNAPECEIYCASPSHRLPSLQAEFDLVLVRGASEFEASLLSRAAFLATFELQSRVRPGGCLAFLARIGAEESASVGHSVSCYMRHVDQLPGEQELHEISGSPRVARPIQLFMTKRQGSVYGIALLRVPIRRPTVGDWKQAIDAALKRGPAPCCRWAAKKAADPVLRSKAA